MLELASLLARRPGQLSGGQRQRAAMGRALIRHPSAFLMDEPLSNSTRACAARCGSRSPASNAPLGVTTVYVTHDQVEAMTMADRVAVMRDGALQQLGAPRELYDQPANLFVAGFIGAPPINLLAGALRSAGGASSWSLPTRELSAVEGHADTPGAHGLSGPRDHCRNPARGRVAVRRPGSRAFGHGRVSGGPRRKYGHNGRTGGRSTKRRRNRRGLERIPPFPVCRPGCGLSPRAARNASPGGRSASGSTSSVCASSIR